MKVLNIYEIGLYHQARKYDCITYPFIKVIHTNFSNCLYFQQMLTYCIV